MAATVRRRLIAVPARLINRAGAVVLRGPLDWPSASWFTRRRLTVLRGLELSTG